MSSMYANNSLVIRGHAAGGVASGVANINAGFESSGGSGPAEGLTQSGSVYPDQKRACADLSLPFDADWALDEIVDSAIFATLG